MQKHGVTIYEHSSSLAVKEEMWIGVTLHRRFVSSLYVVRCNVVAGDWDLLIEVVSPSMDSLGDAILDGLSKVGGIASTQTMVSFYDYSGPASSLR